MPPFFTLTKQHRSRLDEDLAIYETFFKSGVIPIGDEGEVFVEMVTFNGMTESNSRFYEECLGWDGLLVEANPLMRQHVLNNRPFANKFFYAPSCTVEEEAANKTIRFRASGSTMSGVDSEDMVDKKGARVKLYDVPCGTLTDVLLDLFGERRINFYSLDVEGNEPHVINNLDLNAVKVDVLISESWNRMCHERCEPREQVRKTMMKEYGYLLYLDVVQRSDLFIHQDIHKQMSPEWKQDNEQMSLKEVLELMEEPAEIQDT